MKYLFLTAGPTRAAATTAVALATLVLSVLPASAAVPAPAGAAGVPRQIVAEPNPGARAVTLTPAQRQQLLRAADRTAASTGRSLLLGDQEKLIPKDVIKDADGTLHIRYERTYAGLPVLGGDLVVHEHAGARSVTRASDAAVSVPTTKAAVPAATARTSALAAARTRGTAQPSPGVAPRLVVWTKDGNTALAWESVVTGVQEDGTPSELHVVTDARSGKQLRSYEQIRPGVGNSQYSGQVQIGSRRRGDVFELTDPQRGGHATYDLTGVGGNGTLVTDEDDVWGDGTTADRRTAAVDAAFGAQKTWDFYHDMFGRNGIADNGVGASSRVHYLDGYANAFWDDGCFCMTYGDGLDNARPLTELDIAAHEMTHGVTSSTANLTYEGESGGLNEATSDIMGTSVEFFVNSPKDTPDYTIGEKADVRGTGKPLRYMDQPSKDADPVKGTSQDYWTPDTKDLNPHLSSGAANHFFYLLAEGSGKKTVNGVTYNSPTYDNQPVAGLGLHNATNVWYRALTVYMTSSTDYAGARTATLQAAADLFGKSSDAYEAVANAWAAVHVGPRFVQHIAAETPSTRASAVGQEVGRQITATTTRPGSLTYAAAGLPVGLSINAVTGLISGTPTLAGEYRTTISIRNSAAETLRVPFVWTVLASGGDFFVNPDRFDIPNWRSIDSPLTVTGREGNAPKDLKVTVDLVHDFIGGQMITLVSEGGTAIMVKDFVWDTGTELHATFTVDASALPANGTWNLHVQDNTPGIFTVDPGYLDRWSMSF